MWAREWALERWEEGLQVLLAQDLPKLKPEGDNTQVPLTEAIHSHSAVTI